MNTLNPKTTKRYPKLTRKLALHEGHAASKLLWQKILALATPEVREMLFAQMHLENKVRRIVPDEYELLDSLPIDHFELLDDIHKAEGLLTGMTPEVHQEVFQPHLARSIEKLNIG